MKRRIISSILVIVMLVLCLASCGYSYANDDKLSEYAPFTQAEMDALNKAISEIVIKDGDFTNDPVKRATKVLESINSALASVADTTDKKTEGVADALRDIVYYCYYYTAEVNGETYYFATSSMKNSDSTTSKLQLGMSDYDDEFLTALADAFKTFDFKDKVYNSIVASTETDEAGNSKDITAKAGDLVFVTYSYKYTTTVDGASKEVSGKHAVEPMIIEAVAEGETPKTLAQFLCGKKNSVTLSGDDKEFKYLNENGEEVTCSAIKIDFIADGESMFEKGDDKGLPITLKEEMKAVQTTHTPKNENGKIDLPIGTVLHYHVFPTHYVEVSEFTSKNVIDLIYDEKINYDTIIAVLFGEDYVGLDEENEEDKAKLDELKAKVEKYKLTEGETVTTLKELVEKIAKLQEEVDAKKKAYDDAKKATETAKSAYEEAEKKITDKEAKGETPTELEITARDNAKKAYDGEGGKVSLEAKAKEAYDKAVNDKNAKIDAFLAIEDMNTLFEKQFRVYTYNSLQKAYNHEIKMNLAKEIYYLINKHVEVKSVPKDAVKLTYDQLINNYKNAFYTGDDDSDKNSNYKEFSGSFKSYLKDVTGNKDKTYQDALDTVWKDAEEINKPILVIYRLSQAYGVLVDDEEFKKYMKDDETKLEYEQMSGYYGENSVRHAYQFDKLIDYWLGEKESTKAEADDNGYVFETPNYEHVDNGFYDRFDKTPASEADKTEDK